MVRHLLHIVGPAWNVAGGRARIVLLAILRGGEVGRSDALCGSLGVGEAAVSGVAMFGRTMGGGVGDGGGRGG